MHALTVVSTIRYGYDLGNRLETAQDCPGSTPGRGIGTSA